MAGLISEALARFLDKTTGEEPCLKDPDAFFDGPEQDAVGMCWRCPVRQACAAYALEAGEAWGVWGGTTEEVRRAYFRQQTDRPNYRRYQGGRFAPLLENRDVANA